MRSSVARSAQEQSGGRLVGPRRASLEEHLRHGGGQGLRIAVAMSGPRVNGILTASGLRDRRDPEQTVGTAWTDVAASDGGPGDDARLIVEAHDGGLEGLRARSLIDQNPYALVEGICIALEATGSDRAVIEVAGEDEWSVCRLRRALDECVEHGWPAQAIEVAPGGIGRGLFDVHDTSRSVADVLWSLLHEQPLPRCRDCAMAGAEMAELLRRCRCGQADLGDLEALLWRARSIADDHRCEEPRRAYVGVWSTLAACVDEFVATIDAGRSTSGCLPAMPWSPPDAVPAISARWCDSPRLGPSLLVSDTAGEQATTGQARVRARRFGS